MRLQESPLSFYCIHSVLYACSDRAHFGLSLASVLSFSFTVTFQRSVRNFDPKFTISKNWLKIQSPTYHKLIDTKPVDSVFLRGLIGHSNSGWDLLTGLPSSVCVADLC